MIGDGGVRLQRRARPRGLVPAGRHRDRLHRPVRRRAPGRLGDPQPAQQGRHQRHLAFRRPGRAGRRGHRRPHPQRAVSRATGPATSRPTRRATSGSARAATRSPGCPTSRTTPSRAASRSPELRVHRPRASRATVEPGRVQPVHPARTTATRACRSRCSRSRSHNPDRHAIDYTAVGRARPRPPSADASASLVTADGMTGVADRDRRGRPGVARPRRAGARHRRRRHQPPGAPVPRPLVRSRSRSTGRTSHVPGPFAAARLRLRDYAPGMGRNRDSSLVAAHVPVPAGRDADGPLRHRLVCAELPQVLGVAGLALPPGVRGQRRSGATGTRRSGRRRRRSRARRWSAGTTSRGARSPFRDALYGSTLPGAGARRGGRQPEHPQVADGAAPRGRHVLRLGGLPSRRRQLRGQLHPRLELRSRRCRSCSRRWSARCATVGLRLQPWTRPAA